MLAKWTPMRWPAAWKDPAFLELFEGSAVNCLLVARGADLAAVAERARRAGMAVADESSLPPAVAVIPGEWPGVKLATTAADRAAAGPTGAPWIDSNSWKVRLNAALNPDREIWVEAPPPETRLTPRSYVLAVADAAMCGGRWILALDKQLLSGIAAKDSDALRTWKAILEAASFFAGHKDWSGFEPRAVLGIVSDFTGANEFLSREILNLVARTNQQYQILLKAGAAGAPLGELRAVLYPDDQPPNGALRERTLAFVRSGGLLITAAGWGALPAGAASEETHPRYEIRRYGKGRLARCRADFEDPYLIANDAQVLISNRHNLLRLWNAGAFGAHFAADPRSRHSVAQLLFYAFMYGENRTTLRVAGRYRAAAIRTPEDPSPRPLEMDTLPGAVEMRLPPLAEYAAVELEGAVRS